ncbi:unnamed protein product, partial [Prorocentrum cordatum]
GKPPMAVDIGAGEVVEGFEAACRGLRAGQKVSVTVPPEKAYGNRNEDFVFRVPAGSVPKGTAVGEKVMLGGPGLRQRSGDDVTAGACFLPVARCEGGRMREG